MDSLWPGVCGEGVLDEGGEDELDQLEEADRSLKEAIKVEIIKNERR